MSDPKYRITTFTGQITKGVDHFANAADPENASIIAGELNRLVKQIDQGSALYSEAKEEIAHLRISIRGKDEEARLLRFNLLKANEDLEAYRSQLDIERARSESLKPKCQCFDSEGWRDFSNSAEFPMKGDEWRFRTMVWVALSCDGGFRTNNWPNLSYRSRRHAPDCPCRPKATDTRTASEVKAEEEPAWFKEAQTLIVNALKLAIKADREHRSKEPS